jgi:energy-coupling factor transporter ATP-binding protein EcfA2
MLMPSFSTIRFDVPPSRDANPFATCWTRPGALPFHFRDGESAEQLVEKLAKRKWRGTILGPHGSGKSTLLEALKPAIVATGRHIQAISLHNGQRRLPSHFSAASASAANSVVIIDGYEQLGWVSRLQLWFRCRSADAGLLVTSHAPVRIPTLIRLAPDRELVEQLISDLCRKVSTNITPADIAASHACHGSNVREILFDLYDRHEEGRLKMNSLPARS